jgi:cyclopropane fatty-acyl-phospholipid synthase-like methyltransferase
MPSDDVSSRLRLRHYPRSLAYDPRWVAENQMGPHPLWLMEALTEGIALEAGSRVLDLGAGTALTSIFLAREFELSVVASDLWVSPTDNQRRVREAGVERLVLPIHAEAHDLPFGDETFDAILCVDAYHYFGTDDLYLASCLRLLRPGGRIGIVVPGLVAELDELPHHLRPYWDPDCWSFHSPEWWRRHWERSEAVEVERADLLPEGWREWLLWLEACRDLGVEIHESEIRMVREDAGRNLGFSRVVARKL